jgi:2-phospho-L-lactate guanylyltransferase
MTVEAIIPVRTFDGLSRLASKASEAERAATMRRLVDRTASATISAGVTPVIVTADPDVASWAARQDIRVVAEQGAGLDAAAASGIATVAADAWLVIHADLPHISPADVAIAAELARCAVVLAPSHDGGTSLVGGSGRTFPFRYGPGSFRRHLFAVAGDATILVRPGLAIDLDRPQDIDMLEELGWL